MGQLGPRAQRELAIDAREMAFDCLRAEEQVRRRLSVAGASSHDERHLELLRRQRPRAIARSGSRARPGPLARSSPSAGRRCGVRQPPSARGARERARSPRTSRGRRRRVGVPPNRPSVRTRRPTARRAPRRPRSRRRAAGRCQASQGGSSGLAWGETLDLTLIHTPQWCYAALRPTAMRYSAFITRPPSGVSLQRSARASISSRHASQRPSAVRRSRALSAGP